MAFKTPTTFQPKQQDPGVSTSTNRTYPEDEVENEKQVLDAFHPSLHFAHDVTRLVDIADV